MNITGLGADLALIDGHPVDVAHQPVSIPLFLGGFVNDDSARLMAGVSLVIGHVIIADNVPPLEREVALALLGHGVAAAVQDAVGPLGAPLYTTSDDPAMDLPLGVAFSHRGKDFQICFV